MSVEQYSEKLKSSGYEADKVRARLESVANRVHDQLSTLLAVIGSDNFGSKYVEGQGDNGLTTRLQGAVDGTHTMAKSWANLSQGQFEAAVVAERNEDEARRRIEQV
ncbi:hypothetical protein [Nocardia sp. bgisy134]|uniref:hypothetical protein n=1 Tax=unclassified Nocardia TaxID=2637762 RepID=UPI003D7177DD